MYVSGITFPNKQMKLKLYKFVDIPSNVKDVEIYTTCTLSENM